MKTALVLFFAVATCLGAQELRLWPEGAPGSEDWTVPELVRSSPNGDRVISNVSSPTLAVFLPDPAIATGTAVVIAPGGALRVLGYDNEGVKVAEWLTSKGITGFVLKYRTVQEGAAGPPRGFRPPGEEVPQEIDMPKANANPAKGDPVMARVLELAIDDAQQAIRMIRANAGEWHVNPERVGIMGFSAGGGVAIGTALAKDSDAYPDFLISLYGPSLLDVDVPDNAPPLFMAVGSDHFNVTKGLVELFGVWRAAGKPVEMHIYDQVTGGFGMSQRGLPVDGWIDRLYDWMVARKLTDQR